MINPEIEIDNWTRTWQTALAAKRTSEAKNLRRAQGYVWEQAATESVFDPLYLGYNQ
jgi:hypothetical protein